VSLPSEPLLVNGDLVRLAQVVGNLLNNGAKYTPDGGAVSISAQREHDEAVIRVTDNGIGIDREMLPHIFDLFSQAPSARDRRKGGIGVGLSIARQLVQMHGGTLTAESPGLGLGSTFAMRLPLVDWDDLSAASTHGTAGAAAANVLRVLILDDNEDAALTLGTLLEMAGHTVALAHTGREALELAARMSPDIAFLDIGLPDMSGFDVARAMRGDAALAHVRLVALTGWGAPGDREQGRQAGFEHHLTKPVTLDTIAAILPDLTLPTGHDKV
jgi:CheY-like chemotaxis protein